MEIKDIMAATVLASFFLVACYGAAGLEAAVLAARLGQ